MKIKGFKGVTLMEVLIAGFVLAILAAVALPIYLNRRESAHRMEAAANLEAVRRAELARQASGGRFVNAENTAQINDLLGLSIAEKYYSYEVIRASDTDFLIVATRLGALGEGGAPVVIAMDRDGNLSEGTIEAPMPPTVASPGGGGGGSGGGGGGGSGGGGGGGGSEGGGGSGGGGSGAGGSGGSGGSSTTTPGGGGAEPTPDRPLVFIPRGGDIWTSWPEANELNILGTVSEIDRITTAFSFASQSSAVSVTNDIFRRGIEMSFEPTLFGVGNLCGDAIACFVRFDGIARVPNEPTIPPFIAFNPAYDEEEPGVLAAVLVHEGTHLQQYLSGFSFSSTVHEREFTAFWNAAVYWSGARDDFDPFDTDLEAEVEFVYQTALQGEAAMRALIASRY